MTSRSRRVMEALVSQPRDLRYADAIALRVGFSRRKTRAILCRLERDGIAMLHVTTERVEWLLTEAGHRRAVAANKRDGAVVDGLLNAALVVVCIVMLAVTGGALAMLAGWELFA